eukprot:g43160.t1
MADNHNVQGYFWPVKTTYGPNTQGPTPLPAKDELGLIKETEDIKQCCRDHFRVLLIQDSVINLSISEHIPQHATCHELSNAPALHEVEKTVHQQKVSSAEVQRQRDPAAATCPLSALSGEHPQTALRYYRHEQRKQVQLCCRRNAEKRCCPCKMGVFKLTKAFDTINQEALWSILLLFGCAMKFVTILRLLHDDMEVMVMTNGFTTDPFPFRAGIKQGCIITPILLSMCLAAMLHLTADKLPTGMELIYRTCGKLFNLRHFQAKTTDNPISVIKLQL